MKVLLLSFLPLFEPLTNIENGFGVFSAFASDSLYLNAIK